MHDAQPLKLAKPRIALRPADQQALLAIAYRGLLSDTRSAGALLHEASRAELLADDDDGAKTVTLWSRVCFRDVRSGDFQIVHLVPPDEAPRRAGSISVLSPLGAALIGLSEGQHICCPDRHGGELSLTVLRVSGPSQDCGESP